ncbi:MAG: tetratricopeptide repeat protein [Planctomycetia bacterium]|nr:tetratricopeptide repeat protein [Planctomycetia bacterium]
MNSTRTAVRATLVSLVVAGLLAGGGALYVRRDLSIARRLLERGEHREAAKRLQRYLRLYRGDSRARLMLAEALVADDDRPAEDAARDAVAQLERIPDSSPEGAEARTRTGRLLFLILLRPGQAEPLFRRAIELAPDALDAHLMLWNLLNVTGRFHLTQPVFWRVYELNSESERPIRLRDWYLSEFGRGSAFAELDRKLGVLAKKDNPSLVSEYDRLRHIRAAEPDWPVGIAALARLLRGEGQKDVARELVQLAPPEADRDPFFLATRIELAMDEGNFDEAAELFERWPEPHDGYEYWMWRGTIADEIRRDDAEAIAAYDEALRSPLGDTDWQLMSRLAHCLLRAGRADESRSTRDRASQLEKLMERELHQQLRKSFGDLRNPAAVREIIDFYRDLRRDREVAEWSAWLDRISPAESPVSGAAPGSMENRKRNE